MDKKRYADRKIKLIELYTIDNCVYCKLAKDLLKKNNLDYKELNLTEDYEGLSKLINITGSKTMPQIFIKKKFIGGYLGLKNFLEKDGI